MTESKPIKAWLFVYSFHTRFDFWPHKQPGLDQLQPWNDIKMAAPAKFKAENGSCSHAILKIIKNILEFFFFLQIFNLGYLTNILKTIFFDNQGSGR